MTPVTRKVRVKVPATSANLGSGFDTVGLALDYHDELEFTLSADPVNTAAQVMIEGEGEDTLPRDETHLVVSTFRRACQTFGLGRVGFILQAHNNIPQARGMGSSAEAIVAGIAAAAAFAQDDDLNRDAVFELAAAIEGHPDNVAPGRVRRPDHVLGHGDRGRCRIRADSRRRADAQRLPHHQLPRGGRSDRGRVRAGLRAVHRKGPSGVAD